MAPTSFDIGAITFLGTLKRKGFRPFLMLPASTGEDQYF